MNYAKQRRQHAILNLIRSTAIANQQELADHLAADGFPTTQATISRDLQEVGAIKIRRSGRVVYSVPDAPVLASSTRHKSLLKQYGLSIDAAGNLVVIKTPPGSAHLIGVALDQAQIEDIVGTICGDDTIFVACQDNEAAERLAATLDGAGT